MTNTIEDEALTSKSGSAERRSANLALRIQLSLMEKLEARIKDRNCNKSEFVAGILNVALSSDLATQVIDSVEAAKVRQLKTLSRDEILVRLQAAENERTLLRAALASLQPRAIASMDLRPATAAVDQVA